MADSARCSSCGFPLDSSGPGGLCPSCLLKLGLAAGGPATGADAPDGATVLGPTADTHLSAGGVTPRGTTSSSPAVAPSASSPARPHAIGPYRLGRILGEGGMGIVYLAEQDEPIRRTVALKLIKLGMDTHEVVARFEAERQALALMDHPNIASVLDAGAAPDGRPYFVMEYAPGVPLTEFCDAHRLGTRDRLQLFIEVCAAIQHAHQKGIIHRDLKPSNVLVIEQDGRAVPKVIDFGIAKATDQRLTEKTMFTQHGLLMGTPEYMSPEQAELGAVDLDTRTDIYSLGVMLYELLVGTLPFSPTRLREAGYTELLRIIREEEPARPSTRLTTAGGVSARQDGGTPATGTADALDATEVATRRRTKVPTLTQELRGDLDWITLKALEKDRTRRYASVSEFAADLSRYLADEPVSARPPSLGYRVQKFVRRNRLAVTAAAIVALAVVAGLITSSVLYVRAERARGEADRQRATAEDQRREATAQRAEADRQRTHADTQRNAAESARAAESVARSQAESQKAVAQQALATAEENLYFNHIDLADREWAANNVARASELLGATAPRLRNWEWHHLWRLTHMDVEKLIVPGSAVRALAFSGDGQRLFAGTNEMTLLDWELATRRLGAPTAIGDPRTLDKSPLKLSAFAISADGTTAVGGPITAAYARFVNPITVWDVATGRARFSNPDSFTAFALSPDGRRLVTSAMVIGGGTSAPAFGQYLHALRLWDAHTGQELAVLSKASPAIYRFCFSPDGRRIAAATTETSSLPADIKIIDAATGAAISAPGHGKPLGSVGALAFSPDGTRLAAALSLATSGSGRSVAQSVRLWNADDGTEIWTSAATNLVADLLKHDQLSLAFNPGGSELVVALADRTLRVLDAATGRERHRLVGHTSDINALAYAPDGTRIVSAGADQTVRFWTPAPQPAPVILAPPQAGPALRSLTMSGDGHTLLALTGKVPPPNPTLADLPVYTLEGWDLATGRHLFATPPQPRNDAMLWTLLNYAGVATGGSHALMPGRVDIDTGGGNRVMRYALRLFNVPSGASREPLLQERVKGTEVLDSQAVKPVTVDMSIPTGVVIDAEGRRALVTYSRASFSTPGVPGPSSSRGINGNQVDVWDPTTGRKMSTIDLRNPLVEITKVVLSPDVTRAALSIRTPAGEKRETTDYPICELATGRVLYTLRGSEGALQPLVFSASGRSVAAPRADNAIGVWNAITGEKRYSIRIGTRTALLAFSPDESRLLAVSNEGVMTLWNAATGNHVLTIRESDVPASVRELSIADSRGTAYLSRWFSAGFSPDGRQIVLTTIGQDKTGVRIQIKTWDGSPGGSR